VDLRKFCETTVANDACNVGSDQPGFKIGKAILASDVGKDKNNTCDDSKEVTIIYRTSDSTIRTMHPGPVNADDLALMKELETK
jgi:hypothetical protein